MSTRRLHGRQVIVAALVAACGGPTSPQPEVAGASPPALPAPTETPEPIAKLPARAGPDTVATTPLAAPPPAEPEPRRVEPDKAAATPPALPPTTEPAPPPVDPLELLERCQAGPSIDARTAACRELLALPGLQDPGDPNLVSERADAIHELHGLGVKTPLTPEIRRALGKEPRTCVIVHQPPSAGVVSLMCRIVACGGPARWVPFDLEIATGTLRGQQC